jgi:aryl-alcohol dehydrogenase-like predicted oxidoreductase
MRGWEQFVTVQPEYNMLERAIERELVPYCAWANIGVLPYFPLAGGFLTGKYKRGEAPPAGSRGEFSPYVKGLLNDANFDKLDKLRAFVDSRGHTLHDLAFAWLLSNKQVASVIAGATTLEQISQHAATVEWKLSEEELKELNEIL